MNNNVLGSLKADISAGALSLVIQPLSGTAFNLPPGGSDATGVTTGAIKTYGTPVEMLVLVDVVNESQAFMEIIKASTRVPEVGGAYTYTVPAGGRGAEGTTARAWTAGAKVYQSLTAALAEMRLLVAMMRAQAVCVHKRDGVLKWDGTSLAFDSFRFGNVGRGDHWSTDGRYTVAMPANAKVVVGYGGASNITVASGLIALPENTTLYFELNINAANTDADVGDRFRVVGVGSDFVVPNHWLMIASHSAVTAGDGCLRWCNGATMLPFIAVSAFTNSWVNFGGNQQVAGYMKDAAGFVQLRGCIKNGTSSAAAFTLPAGFRPQSPATGDLAFPIVANGAMGVLYITSAGVVLPVVASNAVVYLDGVRFFAGA